MSFGFFSEFVQYLAVMLFSVDEQRNKVLICAFVPNSAAKQGLGALDWLQGSLVPINGTGNSDNDGLAQGEVKSLNLPC